MILLKEIMLRGKVVEISFSGGKQIIKVITMPEYIELTIDSPLDIHLKDEVVLDSKIIIEKITNNISNRSIN